MGNWHKTYQRGTFATAQPDDSGIIRNVVMCQVGEAKGHGVSLDSEFISNVVAFAKDAGEIGIKARFGHPTMSDNSTGDGLGRYRNPRLSEDGTKAIADLHLADYAAASPRGDLKTYITKRANEDPDSFGSSIVFTPGDVYRRNDNGEKVKYGAEGFDDLDGPDFTEIKSLHGCDIVDEPAATDGLFGAENSKSFAVRITQFLDSNPDIFQWLDENPDLPGKVAEFLSKYKAYQKMKEEKTLLQRLGLAKAEPVKEEPATEYAEASQVADLASALNEQGESLSEITEVLTEIAERLDTFSARLGKIETADTELDEGFTEAIRELRADFEAQFSALRNDVKSTYEPGTEEFSEALTIEQWAEQNGKTLPPAYKQNKK